jgi:UPF0755 protein
MIKKIKLVLLLAILAGMAVAAWVAYYAVTPLNIPSKNQKIEIAQGSSLRSVANQLVAQGVLAEPMKFIVLAKIFNKEASLQSGNYTLNSNVSPYQLLFSLNNGKTTQASITFIEGHTFKQMRARLAKNPAIKQTLNKISEKKILQLIDAPYDKGEGLFFPDTFYFDRDTTDLKILKRSYDAMQSKLAKAWDGREADLPYKNAYEALTMASIIEKETGKASERPTIAGVFVNRLRIGMLLQTDPTVIYGIGDAYKGNIRKKHLRTDTPYNTYTRAGLTPTPIAMPGLAAIEAALHPAKTKALYFVGKGDGSHYFSRTYKEHNNAVKKYQLGQ